MYRYLSFALALAVAGIATAADTAPSKAKLEVQDDDAGERYQHTTFDSTLHLTNHGDKAVDIKVMPARKGDTVLDAPSTLEAGKTAAIKVRISVGNDRGTRSHPFSIDAGGDALVARVKVFAQSAVDERPSIDFGVVDAGDKNGARTFSVASTEFPGFRVTGAVSMPDFASATIAPDGQSVSIAVRPEASWGRHGGYLKLATNAAQQPELWVELIADVHGAVVPSSNPFAIGAARLGQRNEYTVTLQDRTKKKLKLGGAKIVGFKGDAKITECTLKAPDCKQVVFTVDGSQPGGRIAGKLLVDVAGYRRELPIDVWGALLDPKTKVVDLNKVLEEASAREAAAAAGGATAIAPASSIMQALRSTSTAGAASDAVVPGRGPLIRWQANNEKEVYGYLVYRGDSAAGPFVRVNREVIKVVAHDDAGATYSWRDESAKPGSEYWYYVGYVSGQGDKVKLSDPQKVVAK